MTEQKKVISFIFGLLLGGLIIWAFSGEPSGEYRVSVDYVTTAPEEEGEFDQYRNQCWAAKGELTAEEATCSGERCSYVRCWVPGHMLFREYIKE
jgi:hypothetical protein